MSQSLAITCERCSRYLVIGKHTNSEGWSIFGDELAGLSRFVDNHFGHPIEFMDLDRVPCGHDDEEDMDKLAQLDMTMPAVLNTRIDYLNPRSGAWEVGKVRRLSIAGGPEQWLLWAADNELIPMLEIEEWRPGANPPAGL